MRPGPPAQRDDDLTVADALKLLDRESPVEVALDARVVARLELVGHDEMELDPLRHRIVFGVGHGAEKITETPVRCNRSGPDARGTFISYTK